MLWRKSAFLTMTATGSPSKARILHIQLSGSKRYFVGIYVFALFSGHVIPPARQILYLEISSLATPISFLEYAKCR